MANPEENLPEPAIDLRLVAEPQPIEQEPVASLAQIERELAIGKEHRDQPVFEESHLALNYGHIVAILVAQKYARRQYIYSMRKDSLAQDLAEQLDRVDINIKKKLEELEGGATLPMDTPVDISIVQAAFKEERVDRDILGTAWLMLAEIAGGAEKVTLTQAAQSDLNIIQHSMRSLDILLALLWINQKQHAQPKAPSP